MNSIADASYSDEDFALKVQEEITEYLIEETISRITGRGKQEVRGNKPSTTFYAGNIFAPSELELSFTASNLGDDISESADSTDALGLLKQNKETEEEDAALYRLDTRRKTHPQSMGLRLLLEELKGEIDVKISFDVWHRAFPTFDQLQDSDFRNQIDFDTIFRNPALRRFVSAGRARFSGVIKLADLKGSAASISAGLKDELKRISDAVITSPDVFKMPFTTSEAVCLNRTGSSFAVQVEGKPIVPKWNAELQIDCQDKTPQGWPLDIRIVNVTESNAKDYDLYENTFFDTEICANVKRASAKSFLDDTLSSEPQRIAGIGINCTTSNNAAGDVSTTSVPVFHEPFIYHTERPGLNIKEICTDPTAHVRLFVNSMKQYEKEFWLPYLAQLAPEGYPDALKEAEEFHKGFSDEISRCERTIALMKEYPKIVQAFSLAHETMFQMAESRAAAQLKSLRPMWSWRSFQFGFILATIPDIVDRRQAALEHQKDHGKIMDLLHFPTAGGKTETFIFLGLFSAFLDRLTEKKRGVSAWYIYPLRALSMQQLERLTEAIYHAEQVRIDREVGGEPFEVGYFVGENYTPNKVEPNDEKDVIERLRLEPTTWVYIGRCPACHQTDLRTQWNSQEWSLEYHCCNTTCRIKIPIKLVDVEIERKPTTFVTGTIDKITRAGLTSSFHSLTRSPEYCCPKHGAVRPYLPKNRREVKCSIQAPVKCEEELIKLEPEDWGASLLVMDEVHVVAEELGAYASHYLSLLWDLQKSGGFPRPKVIAVTATSSGWQEHLWHLTGLSARIFPSSPTMSIMNFYLGLDPGKRSRSFVGIHPHGKTELDAVIHLMRALQGVLQGLRRGGLSQLRTIGASERVLTERETSTILRPYETTLIYVLAKLQGDVISNSVLTQLPDLMRSEGYEPVESCSTISSELSAEELSEILENLADEEPHARHDRREILCATSSLAYGVDIPNLNLLVLLGQPKMVSEDIQITGRVARQKPGIIFRLYHPIRQYDLTSYIHFWSQHANREKLVEAVAINRFSINSVKRTLPGILMAQLFNSEEYRKGLLSLGRHKIAANYLSDLENEARIKESIHRIYMIQ